MIWGLLWYSNNELNGVHFSIIYDNYLPALFKTREQARLYAQKNYGYITKRKDLRAEPHGWRLPKPVKLKIEEVVR